jgi:MFS transporter, FHS family, L-fucose permease
MSKNSSVSKLLPVLFGFFIMGFVDVVGIATNYVKLDFKLTDTLANLLPMMVFLWFFVFSVPTGLLMNKIGRKNTVMISCLITIVAMVIPLVSYQFTTVLIAFALLGIGNTILQVSLNPLMTNLVNGEKLTSNLTMGQFIKAIASFLGPIIASWAAAKLGNWKDIFMIFALITAISVIWLFTTSIEEIKSDVKTSSFAASFKLLGDKVILMFFLGILFVVGVDVGLNTTIPKILQERCSLPLEQAGFGTSLYFVARTAGAFIGAIILARMSGKKYFLINIIIAIAAMVAFITAYDIWLIRILIFIIGFTVANVFSIIFSAALQHMPNKHNEISGLMVMGISGGAFVTLVIGYFSDLFKSQAGGLFVLLAALFYLLFCAIIIKEKK